MGGAHVFDPGYKGGGEGESGWVRTPTWGIAAVARGWESVCMHSPPSHTTFNASVHLAHALGLSAHAAVYELASLPSPLPGISPACQSGHTAAKNILCVKPTAGCTGVVGGELPPSTLACCPEVGCTADLRQGSQGHAYMHHTCLFASASGRQRAASASCPLRGCGGRLPTSTPEYCSAVGLTEYCPAVGLTLYSWPLPGVTRSCSHERCAMSPPACGHM